MSQKITTFLMFQGQAQAALDFYLSLFEDGAITSLRRYPAEAPGQPGLIEHATFTLAGQTFAAIDSPIKHEFGFTPAISLYVACKDEAEIDRLFAAFSEGGAVMMPLAVYPFSPKFAWVSDRFGVSWQLSLTQA